MAGFAVDLSDIDDDPMILFLESHHRVMGATDDAARRLYLRVEGNAGSDVIQCPFCSLQAKRRFLVQIHVLECAERYNDLCTTPTAGSKRRRSDLIRAQSTVPPIVADKDPGTGALTPVEAFDRFVEQQTAPIDPGQCQRMEGKRLIQLLVTQFCDRACSFPRFRELTGIEPSWFHKIVDECRVIPGGRSVSGSATKFRNMILVNLLFMKHYWLMIWGGFILQMPDTTLRQWIEKSQAIMHEWGLKQIPWPSYAQRHLKSKRILERYVVGIVDNSEQACCRSLDPITENSSYSGKYMDNTCTCMWMVDPVWGRVMLVSRSFLGSKNDQQVFDSIDWAFYLQDEETILADMGYASRRVLTKWKRTQGSTLTRAQLKDNAVIDTSRILVENLFAWTGSFAICSQKLRYKTSNNGEQLLFKHNRNHVIICGILNRFSSLRKTPNRS